SISKNFYKTKIIIQKKPNSNNESITSPSIIDVDKFINFQDIFSTSSENESIDLDQDEEISFTLIVKKVDGKLLPEKWLTFIASTFEQFIAQIQKYIKTMIGEEIDKAEYSLTYKSANSNGWGLELSELKDFEKFL
ncbi:17239_t:CDS:1, partial [Funneliformis caledonium]